jgi:2-polyprenyl-3-methyl-5-hydroxy-6-metoxy-1,4-benzoquinol methylase
MKFALSRADKGTRLTVCDLCGTAGRFVRVTRSQPQSDDLFKRIGVREVQDTVVCSECGWVFKPLMLTPDQYNELYALIGGTKTYDTSSQRQTADRAGRIFDRVAAYGRGASKDMTVLDVGGGVGQASLAFAENGNEVHVLDICAGATLHPRIVAHATSVENLRAPAQYGIAIVAHVLEHLWSPSTALKRIFDALIPEGVIYVEVPFELYTPLLLRKPGDVAHVGYFSRRTLKVFLTNAGFRDIALTFQSDTYGSRKVVIISALARKTARTSATTPPAHPSGRLHLAYDLLSLNQILRTIAARL